jgi:peptidoglycan/xylan/chitin deacetylase (PgdA/CDA1 family)
LLKLLNLTKDKERYLNLLLVRDTLGSNSDTTDNVEENIPLSNPIYIEPNEEYYTQLLNLTEYKREILRKNNIYDNEYEQLIEDLTSLIKQDSSVYANILSIKGNNLLIYAINSDILAISQTDKPRGSSEVDDLNFTKDYDVEQTVQSKGSIRIPVIMYHQIKTPPEGTSSFVSGLFTDPGEFEREIAYLTEKNYKTITSQEFLDILTTGNNPTQKTIMLTFDDGSSSHYTQAYPILKKYRQTGVFFVTSHRTEISHDQLKEMADNGMDIQSHTQTHPDLTKLTDIVRMQSEIGGSKTELEARTGKKVLAIAYPGCVAGSQAFSMTSANGYQLGFSCGKSIDHRYSTRLSLSRVHAPKDIEGLKQILSGIYPF